MNSETAAPPILILTPGDPAGIGPEITWKVLQSGIETQLGIQILCVGARAPFEKLGAPIRSTANVFGHAPAVWLEPAPAHLPKPELHLGGYQSGWSIQRATEMVLSGYAAGLVTGPISKENLQAGGYHYPGHTEFLAALCAVRQDPVPVTMMLANTQLRVTLVTTHLALKDVPASLSEKNITQTVLQTAEGLRQLWGIEKPKIAVSALNPHAGEAGLFGDEEIMVLKPVIEKLRAEHQAQFTLVGPLPADTLFANHFLAKPAHRFDAVVCMYHDQGLIPVKLLDFHRTINVTLGLPMIRTSVDHGVGFDIVGKNQADPASLSAAIHAASDFLKKRRFVHET